VVQAACNLAGDERRRRADHFTQLSLALDHPASIASECKGYVPESSRSVAALNGALETAIPPEYG
jgi:hypothetical protein